MAPTFDNCGDPPHDMAEAALATLLERLLQVVHDMEQQAIADVALHKSHLQRLDALEEAVKQARPGWDALNSASQITQPTPEGA